MDLGKPTPLRLVATYDRVNRQAAVSANFALFSGFDPKENEAGELLATAVGSDPFWRLFPVARRRPWWWASTSSVAASGRRA